MVAPIDKDLLGAYKLLYDTGIDVEKGVVSINQEIDDDVLERIRVGFRLLEDREITIMLNTPGGDVIVGMAIIDYMRAHTARWNKPVHVVVDGLAASMGCVITQGATGKRICRPNSVLMHHVGSMSISSDHFGNVKNMVKFQDKYGKRINQLMLSRVNDRRALLGLEPRSSSWWEDRDTIDQWMDAEGALELGLIDEISLVLP